MTLADLKDRLERGRMGHAEAMRWLGVDSSPALVEIVHANGRQMPGRRPMPVSAETRALVRGITKPLGRPAGR